MEQKMCINTTNQKVFRIAGENETTVILEVEGKLKSIKLSTFKRYYRILTVGKDNKIVSDKQQTAQQVEPKLQKQVETQQKEKQYTHQGGDKNVVWNKYYKKYKRNVYPLWNGSIEQQTLFLKDQQGNKLIECTMSKTLTCIKVKQLNSGAKRYFTNFDQAKKHVLYDQDIKTIEYIGKLFEKWLSQVLLVKENTR